jgi:hypothetical protein
VGAIPTLPYPTLSRMAGAYDPSSTSLAEPEWESLAGVTMVQAFSLSSVHLVRQSTAS